MNDDYRGGGGGQQQQQQQQQQHSDVPGPFLRVQRFYVGRGFQGREVDV